MKSNFSFYVNNFNLTNGTDFFFFYFYCLIFIFSVSIFFSFFFLLSLINCEKELTKNGQNLTKMFENLIKNFLIIGPMSFISLKKLTSTSKTFIISALKPFQYSVYIQISWPDLSCDTLLLNFNRIVAVNVTCLPQLILSLTKRKKITKCIFVVFMSILL